MLNPMTHEFVRVAHAKYPAPLSDLISAVDSFAYGASWPIESFLGEYAGKFFDSARLRHAVQVSIWDDSDFYSRGAHSLLIPVFNASGLSAPCKNKIFTIVNEEALKRINQGVQTVDGTETYREHGHHGRQYIARNATARVVQEVLPPWSRALVHHYKELKKA